MHDIVDFWTIALAIDLFALVPTLTASTITKALHSAVVFNRLHYCNTGRRIPMLRCGALNSVERVGKE
jgi:hypothetical protein